MKKVEAYQCIDGHVELDKDRALAWNLVHIARQNSTGRGDPVSFSAALWLVTNKELVINLLSEKSE
jgi:hypothetical protein